MYAIGRVIMWQALKIIPKGSRTIHYTASRYTQELIEFSSRKSGTAQGPFSELPEFKPLQGSMMLKLPSFCTIYTRLDKISALNVEQSAAKQPFLSLDALENAPFSKVSTGEHPVNATMVSSTPMSNITIIQIDDYKQGWYLTDPENDVLCYSGDLKLEFGHSLRGRGIVAIGGKGPVYQLNLEPGENITVNPDSILGYNDKVSLRISELKSKTVIPQFIKSWSKSNFALNFGHYYDRFALWWGKLFHKDKIYCKIQGPGSLLLQTAFVPGSKVCSDDELLKAFKQ
ncbi:LAFE_0F12816g1_1 [Lachancea fermentati]|uniref:Altered inheritance of mitochondria protein 24, mitochondrial n=1 Tax=Lachancea fermentati TaxID=4955 RepID=A0A1G4MG33_LACFM|nr:LAFE_0F12816g1_1 [Lachancea fermentati]